MRTVGERPRHSLVRPSMVIIKVSAKTVLEQDLLQAHSYWQHSILVGYSTERQSFLSTELWHMPSISTETDRSLWVWSKSSLHGEFWNRQGYTERLCLKSNNNKWTKQLKKEVSWCCGLKLSRAPCHWEILHWQLTIWQCLQIQQDMITIWWNIILQILPALPYSITLLTDSTQNQECRIIWEYKNQEADPGVT